MNPWAAWPLGAALACLLVTWLLNRRPKLTGVLWPAGLALSSSLDRPDLTYDGDVVLGGNGAFGTVHCRRLLIARGANVTIETVEAARVRVDGRLSGVELLGAGKRIDVHGELVAKALVSARIFLRKRSRTNVLTVGSAMRIDRHPLAEVKGFFTDADDLVRAGLAKRPDGTATVATPRTLTSGPVSIDCGSDAGEVRKTKPQEDDTDRSITVLSPRTRISKG